MFLSPFSEYDRRDWTGNEIPCDVPVHQQLTLAVVFQLLRPASCLLEPNTRRLAKAFWCVVDDTHPRVVTVELVEAVVLLPTVEVTVGCKSVLQPVAPADSQLATARCRDQQFAFCLQVQSSSVLPALELVR